MTIDETDPSGQPEPGARVRAPRVFLSYSHADEAVLESLLPYLNTLEDEGLVDIWSDREIKGGEQWRTKIDAALDAATIAVLLISQRFLASRFVCEEELPRILAQQQAGQMTVLPVFVEPSTVRTRSVKVRDAEGKERRIVLSEFQGFGTSGQTLSELALPERQRAFVALHERIRELATGKPIAPEAPPTPPAVEPAPTEPEPSDKERKGFPFGAVVAAVAAIVGIVLGILRWRSLDYSDAVTQFENGSRAGIRALAGHGDKGIRDLVDGLDATGESKPELFPVRTLGIIEVLRDRPAAVEKHRAALEADAARNRRKIESLATTLESDLEKNFDVDPQQAKQLRNLARVAACMNRLLGSDPPDWPELATRVRNLLRELPTCEQGPDRRSG